MMKRSFCGAAMLLLVFLTGCGDVGTADPTGESPSPAPRQEQTAVYNLLEEKWAGERREAEILSWSVADCLEVSLPDWRSADFSYYFSAVEGSCYYVLQDLLTKQGEAFEHALYWAVTDAVSGESTMEQWTLQAAPETEGETASLLEAFEDNRAWITGMDVSGDKIYLFFQQDEAQETTHYYKARTDREGHIEELLDLLPALQEGEMLPQENMLLPGGRCDSAGRCYVGDGATSRIGVMDQEGRLLTVLEEPGEAGEPLTYIGKLPEGIPLYACGNFKEQRLVILGYDGQGQKEFYRGEYELLQQCLIQPDGDLLYGTNGRLLRWNVVQGTCENLYDGKNLNFLNCDGILEGAGGKVFAVFRQEDGTFLYGFTDREMETVVIRLELLCRGDDYIQTCASEYGRRHPGVIIEVTEPEGDTELQLNRTMARLTQGEGPELLLVRRTQLQALQREGVLAELSQVLPAGEQEQIFPGVLQNGRIGDSLYGITYSTVFSTLLVSDQVWQEETWSLEDILQLLEERERAGNAVEQFSALPYSEFLAFHMLYDLVLANIGNSSFLDLQAGNCHFDTEEFRQVLELCKRWKQEAQSSQLTEQEMVLEGKALVYKLEGNLIDFSRAYASLGEDFHAVGYPTQGKAGNLLMSYDGCVAVSAAADHREIIDDFLRFLVSYKAQKQYGMNWVRTDVLRDSVTEQVEFYDYPAPVPVFRQGDRSVIVLMGKQDGSSYLPEFLETAGNAIPYETELDMIRNIVQEEADAYFAGDKGLQETAEIIQSRVQLYLDESR